MTLEQIIEKEYHACGFAAARVLPFVLLSRERERFAGWLEKGYGADMEYLYRSAEYRHDLRRLMPSVKSVVVTLTSYNRESLSGEIPVQVPRIARFAWGRDYHDVLKEQLRRLLDAVRSYSGYEEISGRAVTDSAPALERAWAVRAGLGWIGRSSMLIHPRLGSYTLIGLLLLDRELPDGFAWPDLFSPRCGNCRRCLENCPTQAICSCGEVDARRCLSYQTIERREAVAEELRPLLQGRVFGCDRCLEVCPYNHTPSAIAAGRESVLGVSPEQISLSEAQWRAMTEEEFRERFRGTSLLRAGLAKIKSSL